MQQFVTTAAFVAATVATVSALPKITVKDSKLFAGNQQFYVKGFADQGTGADPLINDTQCTLDFNLMKTLGTNSIRVYHVDPEQDHTECMKALEKAGIYLCVDLDTVVSAITTASAPECPCGTIGECQVPGNPSLPTLGVDALFRFGMAPSEQRRDVRLDFKPNHNYSISPATKADGAGRLSESFGFVLVGLWFVACVILS